MKTYITQCILCAVFLSCCLPVSAQDTLVLSAVEGSPPVSTVGEVLRQAYQQLGIQITLQELPGLRGLEYSNDGDTDGEAFRVSGIEKKFPNLVRVDVSLKTSSHYLFVKPGKEFVVEGWESIPKDYTIGYRRGIKVIEDAIAKYGFQAEAVSRPEQLFLKLDTGRNDVIIANDEDAARSIQALQLQEIIRLDPPIDTHHLYHYLHKKHADLVPKITAVLQEMEVNGEIQMIRKRVEDDMNQQ